MNGMKNMTLAHMADACGGILYGREEDRDREVCAITTDSRKAEPGCLFAAIPGERVDGHDFIGQVFEMGALCVITEREPGAEPGSEAIQETKAEKESVCTIAADRCRNSSARNYIKVDSTLRALGALAAYYLEQLAIPVVGITGSVGKTSTKEMIAAVLSQKYRTLKTAGNFNNELGLPLTIFRLREEDEIAVLEMGINHFGEMHRLAAIAKPDTCVITNIGQCHLEFLGDRDGVLRAKTEIFDYLRQDAHIVLNGDDDKLATVREVKIPNADSNSVIRPTFFGFDKENDIYAEQIEKKGLDGIACQICIRKDRNLSYGMKTDKDAGKERGSKEDADESVFRADAEENTRGDAEESVRADADTAGGYDSFTVQIPIPGEHMVRNALAATAVGLHYGLTMEEIRAGIESLQPVSGRFHIIHTENFTIIDDCYNANPMSMKASLGVLQDSGTGSNDSGNYILEGYSTSGSCAKSSGQRFRRVAILGDMGELGEDEVQMHRSVGEYAAGLDIDLCICVGALSTHIAEAINEARAADADNADNASKSADGASTENVVGAAGAGNVVGAAGTGNVFGAIGTDGAPAVRTETVVLPDLQALLAQLPLLVRKGDTILVKASHFMHFEKVVAALETLGSVEKETQFCSGRETI